MKAAPRTRSKRDSRALERESRSACERDYPRIDGTQSSRFAITASASIPNWFLAYTMRES